MTDNTAITMAGSAPMGFDWRHEGFRDCVFGDFWDIVFEKNQDLRKNAAKDYVLALGKTLNRLAMQPDGLVSWMEKAIEIAENPGFIQARDTEWDEGVNYAKQHIADALRTLLSNPKADR